MGEIATRGPLVGQDLEQIGDRLKKRLKKDELQFSRRGVFGGFAGLAALAAAATLPGRGPSVAALGLLPEDLPEKRYRAAFSEAGYACT